MNLVVMSLLLTRLTNIVARVYIVISLACHEEERAVEHIARLMH